MILSSYKKIFIIVFFLVLIIFAIYLYSNQQQSAEIAAEKTQNNKNELEEDTDMDKARNVLITYFDLLVAGQYGEALQYHGSGYDIFHHWNTNIPKSNHSQLLEYGCKFLQCLRIKNVLKQEQMSDSEFRFIVQFDDGDGEIFFRLDPCCVGGNETDKTKITEFEFMVEKFNDNFVVTTEPVYVP